MLKIKNCLKPFRVFLKRENKITQILLIYKCVLLMHAIKDSGAVSHEPHRWHQERV